MRGGEETKYILIAAGCAVFGALGQLFFKLGAETVSLDIFSWIFNFWVITGLIFYGIATIVFIMTLKKAELSLLYPVIATSYIWVGLFSVFIIGETVSLVNWLGFALIIGGVTLTSIKKW